MTDGGSFASTAQGRKLDQPVEVVLADGVATIALGDAAAGNALSLPMMAALRAALRQAQADPAVRVARIQARGRHFCVGADLGWIGALATGDAALWQAGMDELLRLLEDLRRLDKPVVARVHGAVVGGGVGLLCLCDAVIATQDSRWKLPELPLGMVPTALIAPLRARVAPAALKRLLFEARTWDGSEALAFGLATELAPVTALDAAVAARVAQFASLPPGAFGATKRLLATLDHDAFALAAAAIRPLVEAAPASPESAQRLGALLARTAR